MTGLRVQRGLLDDLMVTHTHLRKTYQSPRVRAMLVRFQIAYSVTSLRVILIAYVIAQSAGPPFLRIVFLEDLFHCW
jgi:hypothetical protein